MAHGQRELHERRHGIGGAAIRDDPEFSAMLAEVQADVALQLERVRELERAGRVPAGPPVG